MLTTRSKGFVAEVHDRMPVLLTPEKWEDWLKGADKSLLRPTSDDYPARKAVSKRVNSSKAEGRRDADRGRGRLADLILGVVRRAPRSRPIRFHQPNYACRRRGAAPLGLEPLGRRCL
jgi:hypothetical protein